MSKWAKERHHSMPDWLLWLTCTKSSGTDAQNNVYTPHNTLPCHPVSIAVVLCTNDDCSVSLVHKMAALLSFYLGIRTGYNHRCCSPIQILLNELCFVYMYICWVCFVPLFYSQKIIPLTLSYLIKQENATNTPCSLWTINLQVYFVNASTLGMQ